MSHSTSAPPAEVKSVEPSKAPRRNLGWLWPFICLLLVEIIAFGVNVKNVGVYQDEWILFGYIHFVPHTFLNVLSTFVMDERVVVRPLLGLHLGTLYFLAWEKPLLYHVVCYAVEFLGGLFLYLAVARICRNRAVALAAAVLFLLYPNHDATHYDICASGYQLSASLFTLSLWLFVKGIDDGRKRLVLWSGLAYFLSLMECEQTLPLLVLYPILALLFLKPDKRPPRNYRLVLAYLSPFIVGVAVIVLYRAWLLPALGIGWRYAMRLSVPHFLSVIAAGVNVSLSPHFVSFCASMIGKVLREGLPVYSWLLLAVAVCAVWLGALRVGASSTVGSRNGWLIVVGILTLLLSYTIFGVSPEHMPVIDA